MLLKVLAQVLREFPRFNASIDLENNEIIYKRHYHIGIATDTDRGLLMPVVRDVDQKSIKQLSLELVEMAERTRNKKISPDELDGGTFTISNQGSIGGTDFTPIVYWPQVAILGVSRASVQPVYENGAFVPRTILPLTLSYDHRVNDGADAARFLKRLAHLLEAPLALFLDK
jgi:pyruvate dehydrogenase E2 component (dihydrolipoamide acetyltransferase)